MNKKSILRGLWLAVLAISMALGGCADYNDENNGPGDGMVDDAEVILNLRLPGHFPGQMSRALDIADENEVQSVRVLVFDEHNKLLDITRATLRGANSFTVALPSMVEGVRVKLVLLANADDILSNSIGFDPNAPDFPSNDYVVLMPLISAQIAGPMFADTNRIPMWGETEYIEIVSGSQRENVSLMRSVARIDVGIGRYMKLPDGTFVWNGLTGPSGDPESEEIPFEMTSVYIVRPNDRFSVAPVLSNIDYSGADGHPSATMPSIPAETAPFDTFADDDSEELFRYDIESGKNYTTREIYVPEADIRTGGKNRHRDRMAIVVGGRFADDTEESYYRIDIGSGDRLDDVLRNHLYTFSITNVIGSGFPSVEAAYNSQAMNMTVDVLDWDQAIISNIWFEGTNYFAMNTQSIMFGALPGETLKLSIRTNIPDFEFHFEDDPNELVRLSSVGTTYYDSSQRQGYIYTLTKADPTMLADDEYILEIYNPRDNVGVQPDPGRRVDWIISAQQLRMRFHVDQKWSSGETSLQDRQGTYLMPEGTAGKAIPIEIISLYPVEMEVSEIVDGVAQGTADWIDLGDTSNLSEGGGADYFYYKHDLEIAPFEYGVDKDGTKDRMAVITIYIPETDKVVNYTISQQAPYVRIDRETVSASRPIGGSGAATIPIFVYTNLDADHLQVTQTAGDESLIRLLNAGELIEYDPRNQGNRRFDVGVIYDPAITTMYSATFGVSDNAGIYGDMPVEYVDVVVPPANQTFDAFWSGAMFGGAGFWTPAQMTLPLNESNYVFPWNTGQVSFDAVSNIGLEPDPAFMAQEDIDRLNLTGPTDYDPANAIELYRYTYTPDKRSYSATSTHRLAFISTMQPDLVTGDVNFRLGVQVFQVGENAWGSRRIDWNGHLAAAPGVIDITDNVSWSASAATDPMHGQWLRVRAENGSGGSTGVDFVPSFVAMDDRVYEPIELPSGRNYENNTANMLVNNTELQFVIDPLDFYVPGDNSQPESRVATITIRNNDYDAQRLGATNPAPITITQWNRVLRSEGSDMPDYTLLRSDDMKRTYTFGARTNLDSWRVDIWEADEDGDKVGTNPVPLVSKRYSGTMIWDVTNAPLVDYISGVELPAPGPLKRNLLVTLSADGLTEAHEQRVGLWTQPSANPHPTLPFGTVGTLAPPGVLGVDVVTGELTLRGSKEYAGDPFFGAITEFGPPSENTVYIAMFKRGSLVGISSRNAAYSKGQDAVWAAPLYNVEDMGAAWNNIPTSPNAADPFPANNEAAGYGDPCRYANGYSEGDGPFRTPPVVNSTLLNSPGRTPINTPTIWSAYDATSGLTTRTFTLPGGGTITGGYPAGDNTFFIPQMGSRTGANGTLTWTGNHNWVGWVSAAGGNNLALQNNNFALSQNAPAVADAMFIRCVLE